MNIATRVKRSYYGDPRSPIVGLMFVAPLIIYIVLFFGYPLLFNISLGFQETSAISFITGESPFNGLENYKTLFSMSSFQKALRNTAIWTIFSLLFQFGVGFLLALMFNREFPGEKILRGLLLIPWFLPLIVTANAFRFFFSEQGVINGLLMAMGYLDRPYNWLTNPQVVIWTLTAVNIWIGIPFNFVLLHAGLKEIPGELYEAADVDGANSWQRFVYITLPSLRPVILTVLMLGVVYTIKHFDIVWIMTQGGPANSSHLLSTLSYQLAFRQYQFGVGAAVSNFMVLIILVLVFGFMFLNRHEGRER